MCFEHIRARLAEITLLSQHFEQHVTVLWACIPPRVTEQRQSSAGSLGARPCPLATRRSPDMEAGSTAWLTSPCWSKLGSNWPVRTELFMTNTLGSAGDGLSRPAGGSASGGLRGTGFLAFFGSAL